MFTVTTADGCTSTITYQQIVVPLEIEVPNLFSPNGDGQNDALVFTGAEYYPGNKLSVYNHWGQPIYEASSYRNTWRAPDVAEHLLLRAEAAERERIHRSRDLAALVRSNGQCMNAPVPHGIGAFALEGGRARVLSRPAAKGGTDQ